MKPSAVSFQRGAAAAGVLAPPRAVTCSFCGKSEHEVHVVNGPAVAICEECVLLCVNILLERPNCKAVSDAIIHAAVNITPGESIHA